MLLGTLVGRSRAGLHAHPDAPVEPPAAARYRDLIARRAAREPLQYLTGVQEFWSMEFRVTPAVLIPRPETEGIVEAFLRLVPRPDPVVLDIGTGSGCLAVAVATERPAARVVATDISADALGVARDNATAHRVEDRVQFLQGDLFEACAGLALEGTVDAVVSNPPYVPDGVLAGLVPEVRDHEPVVALVGGHDGLDVVRRLVAGAVEFLRPGGVLVAEIGLGQDGRARALAESQPGLEAVTVDPDLAGIPRVLVARRRAT